MTDQGTQVWCGRCNRYTGKAGGKEKQIMGKCQKQGLQHLQSPSSDLPCSPATWRQGVPPPPLLSVLVHTSHVHLPAGEPLSLTAILLRQADQMVRTIPS